MKKIDGDGGKDDRIKRMCFHCKRNTEFYCFGCRRWLCFMAPLVKKDSRKKHPKYFVVNTPVLDNSKNSMDDGSGGDIKTITETGEWTCYHAAHQQGWNAFIQLHQKDILNVAKGRRLRRNSFG